MVSFETFRTRLIPALIKELKFVINKILKDFHLIFLVPDGWKCPIKKGEFLGLPAITIKDEFTKLVILIGLNELKNGHSASETKVAIENIVNEYSFDSKKIMGIFFNKAFMKILKFESNFLYLWSCIMWSR